MIGAPACSQLRTWMVALSRLICQRVKDVQPALRLRRRPHVFVPYQLGFNSILSRTPAGQPSSHSLFMRRGMDSGCRVSQGCGLSAQDLFGGCGKIPSSLGRRHRLSKGYYYYFIMCIGWERRTFSSGYDVMDGWARRWTWRCRWIWRWT
jgi:hypothetical protein